MWYVNDQLLDADLSVGDYQIFWNFRDSSTKIRKIDIDPTSGPYPEELLFLPDLILFTPQNALEKIKLYLLFS